MSERLNAIVAGHLCLDILPGISGITPAQFNATFGPGRLLEVGPVTLSTGGPVSNTGLALHKLGIPTRLMGKIGEDLFGSAVRDIVAGFDPQLVGGMIADPAVSTSYTVVISPPGIDRYFMHCPGANDTFGSEDIRYDLLQGAALFHFGYPPLMKRMYAGDPEELATIFRRARATGVTTSLDTAYPGGASATAPWQAILGAALPCVDIFLPSIEEILMMLWPERFAELARQGDILEQLTPGLLRDVADSLIAMGPAIVGLKLGDRGLYLRTAGAERLARMGRARPSDLGAWAGRELWAPCFRVTLVGTAGSGDATIAGFLAALLRELSAPDAVTAAVAVGACNVEAADSLSGLRTWDETLARVAAGWPQYPLTTGETGWRQSRAGGPWLGPRDGVSPGTPA